MKATIDLPDELIYEIKIRAVNENRSIKSVVADALRRGLAHHEGAPRRRVELPLIRGAHHAPPDEEMTPDRIAEILLDEDASNNSAGHGSM